ncbi:MAG: hypothetical protein BWY84_00717 [Candidatus Aerophobetes bacterium ADurb.Bin490]|nr:MAG: hypothetical protein BWY84_00717 [Candidatus Aerophobetes bacterium ADurb.Bin490]
MCALTSACAVICSDLITVSKTQWPFFIISSTAFLEIPVASGGIKSDSFFLSSCPLLKPIILHATSFASSILPSVSPGVHSCTVMAS